MVQPSERRPRLLIVVNDARFFLSHRLGPAAAARGAGWDVQVATPPGPEVARVLEAGFQHHPIPMSRSGMRPGRELRTLYALFGLFRRLKPDLLHLVTIKPCLYGGLAARAAGVPGVVFAVSGLGTVFVSEERWAKLLRPWLRAWYALALRHRNSRVIVQNAADGKVLYAALGSSVGSGGSADTIELIPGSGVDLRVFRPLPEPEGAPVVLFAGRMLAEKGVYEFVEAARLLHRSGTRARFVLAGGVDHGNPGAVLQAELERMQAEGTVEWLGHCEDMPSVLARSHIVCLPSYYGEGLPKILIEAAAAGRAVVTTDHPGCRDAVQACRTGLLVPVRDPQALASALKRLLGDGARRQEMGRAARALAEERYSLEAVTADHLRIYAELLRRARGEARIAEPRGGD